MIVRRVFHRSASGLIPELPSDLLAVCDISGLRWNRIFHPSTLVNGFAPDDPFDDPSLPEMLSWHQLIVSRDPVVECISTAGEEQLVSEAPHEHRGLRLPEVRL